MVLQKPYAGTLSVCSKIVCVVLWVWFISVIQAMAYFMWYLLSSPRWLVFFFWPFYHVCFWV